MRIHKPAWLLAAPLLLAVLGLECEKLPTPNEPPRTFFAPGGAPDSTLINTDFTFQFFGSDPDTDRRGYEWRMLRLTACDSAAIAAADSVDWNFVDIDQSRVPYSFNDPVTHPDGPYVFQARTIDERGLRDREPLTHCFVVAIQLAPIAEITDTPPARAGIPSYAYRFTAHKFDRAGNDLHLEDRMEFQWTFIRVEPNGTTLVPFGNWSPLPEAPVDGLQGGSTYAFRVRARDKNYPLIESELESHQFEN